MPATTVNSSRMQLLAIWEAFVGEDQRWRKLLPLLPKNTGLN